MANQGGRAAPRQHRSAAKTHDITVSLTPYGRALLELARMRSALDNATRTLIVRNPKKRGERARAPLFTADELKGTAARLRNASGRRIQPALAIAGGSGALAVPAAAASASECSIAHSLASASTNKGRGGRHG